MIFLSEQVQKSKLIIFYREMHRDLVTLTSFACICSHPDSDPVTVLIKTYLLLLLQWFLTLYTDCSICIYSIGDHTLFLLCGTLREKSLNHLISLFKKEIVLQDFWHWSEQTPSVNHFDNDFLAAVSSDIGVEPFSTAFSPAGVVCPVVP